MKRLQKISILLSLTTLLISPASLNPALALDNTASYESIDTQNWKQQYGTDAQQARLLTQINEGLVNGIITPEDAAAYKERLNNINSKESWYKTYSKPVPQELISANSNLLNELANQLKPSKQNKAVSDTGLYFDINDSISGALAKNRITSSQAAKYFQQLAQIESKLQSLNLSDSHYRDQSADLNRQMCQLKAQVTH